MLLAGSPVYSSPRRGRRVLTGAGGQNEVHTPIGSWTRARVWLVVGERGGGQGEGIRGKCVKVKVKGWYVHVKQVQYLQRGNSQSTHIHRTEY